MCKVIAVGIQKGGTGKTQTTVNLGVGLAKKGKKVLVIDADPQSSLTVSLGWQRPDLLEITTGSIMEKVIGREFFFVQTSEKRRIGKTVIGVVGKRKQIR